MQLVAILRIKIQIRESIDTKDFATIRHLQKYVICFFGRPTNPFTTSTFSEEMFWACCKIIWRPLTCDFWLKWSAW